MNKFVGVLVILFAVVISGCTVNKKAQLQALADCRYEIESIEQMTLNGRGAAGVPRNRRKLQVIRVSGFGYRFV